MDEQETATAEPSETETQATEQPQAAAAEGPPGETAAQRRWRLQVDGAEEELDDNGLLQALIEAHGEDGLRNITQLSKSARRAKGEVEHQKRQIAAAVDDLKDPSRRWALLERIVGGRDRLREELEDFYARDLEERQLSPKEREKRSLETDIERMRREKEELEREKSEREQRAMQEQYIPRFQRDFTAALTQVGTEPDHVMLADMARYVEAEIADVRTQAEYEALVKEAARAVAREHDTRIVQRAPKLAKDKRVTMIREALKDLRGEELFELLGEEGVREFRRADVERVKSKGAPVVVKGPPVRKQAPAQREKRSLDDFFTTIRNGDKI